MMSSIIMALCMLPILLLMYFMERNECKPKKGLILGVTLPAEAQASAEVQAIVARCRRQLLLVCLGYAALCVPLFFIRSSGWSITLWMLWMVGVCIVPVIPHARANTQLKVLKRERGWQQASSVRLVDTRADGALPKAKGFKAMLPPLLICLLPCISTVLDYTGQERSSRLTLYVLDICIILFFWGCNQWFFRRQIDAVSASDALNQSLLRARHLYWNRCWVWSAWATAGLNTSLWLFFDHPIARNITTTLFSLALSVAVLYAEFATRRAQERLTGKTKEPILADEDDCWLWGILYYNPQDKHVIVNKRVGISTTMNLATRAGQLTIGAVVIMLAACLMIGPSLIILEAKPTTLALKGAYLVSDHGGTKYSLALSNITQVELHDTLPPASRTWGTGLEHYLQGTFAVEGYGSCELCLDPTAPPFLYVKTLYSGYWFNASDPAATQAAYEALQAR